eukprot:2158206-Rhodomonas_salina.7
MAGPRLPTVVAGAGGRQTYQAEERWHCYDHRVCLSGSTTAFRLNQCVYAKSNRSVPRDARRGEVQRVVHPSSTISYVSTGLLVATASDGTGQAHHVHTKVHRLVGGIRPLILAVEQWRAVSTVREHVVYQKPQSRFKQCSVFLFFFFSFLAWTYLDNSPPGTDNGPRERRVFRIALAARYPSAAEHTLAQYRTSTSEHVGECRSVPDIA